jgi:hypothetical protein
LISGDGLIAPPHRIYTFFQEKVLKTKQTETGWKVLTPKYIFTINDGEYDKFFSKQEKEFSDDLKSLHA